MLPTSTIIRVKRKLQKLYYWEVIAILGGKLLEMNLGDFPIKSTTG